MTTIPVPTSADIAAAVERCTPLLRRTLVLATTPGDVGLSVSVTLKLESLQHAGSFKARGSLNTALGLGVPADGLRVRPSTSSANSTTTPRQPVTPVPPRSTH